MGRSQKQLTASAHRMLINAFAAGITSDAEAVDFAVRAMGEAERELVERVFRERFALRGPV